MNKCGCETSHVEVSIHSGAVSRKRDRETIAALLALNAALRGAIVKPLQMSLALTADGWEGTGPYTQDVTEQVTAKIGTPAGRCKVDLQPDEDAVATLRASEVTFLAVRNRGGVFTAIVLGGPPSEDVTLQATVLETGASQGELDNMLSRLERLAAEAAEAARLAEQARPTLIEVTLPADGWVDNVQTALDERFIALGYSYLVVALDDADDVIEAGDVTEDGKMPFTCMANPMRDVHVTILRLGAEE